MKKTSLLFMAIILTAMIVSPKNALAIAPENMTGDPQTNENHFIWSIMSQLQTPDDSDCDSVAQSTLVAEGVPLVDAASISVEACNGIASMRTGMQSGMNSNGMSVETNLWDATDWHSVENLYFKHSTNGVADGQIAFSQPIDFMSYAFMNFMMNFGNNMNAREAYISLDADTVGGFANYGATLTMYNVPEFDDPIIRVDGGEDAEGIVSNLNYDRVNNIITFSASHFTSFEAIEGGDFPEIDKMTARKFLNYNGNKKIRIVAYGKNFDKDVDVKLGSRSAYKTKRFVNASGADKVEAYFDLDDAMNAGHKKLTVHLINSDGSETDYDDKVDLDNLKPLNIWKYEKIYKRITERERALGFVMDNPDYIKY